ncbi:MAG: alkylhydroperoxidase family enzyme [Paraglaciecola sp.]|jgi:alkylhydroperoxidase family enzyme
MMKVDNAIIEALRNGATLPTQKLQVLHTTTLALVRNRGHLSQDETSAFIEAGYEKRNLLEIVLGISQKVMSNYVNHLSETPVDDAFKEFE